MATELHLSHSPVPRIKRQMRELKSNDDVHRHLLHEVIESNLKTQQSIAEVSRSINDFVNTIKSVSDIPEEAGAQKPAPRVSASEIEQKLDRIATQNLQLIELISELVKHLKKGSASLAPPPGPQAYEGTYPQLRQLR
ncbi:MAG: hypothetical protein V1839_01145 [archaeon]